MRSQQQTVKENSSFKPRKKTQKRYRIRYGRITTAILLLVLFSTGIALIFHYTTVWIRDNVATRQVKAIDHSTNLALLEEISLSKEEPARFQGQLQKVAYLTFDDGPSKYTDAILDILRQHEAKATFFMIGSQLSQHEDAVKRLVNEGNYPGLHSISHDYNELYKSGSSTNFINEFQQEQEKMQEIVGFTPDLIRAPYGSSPQIDETFRADIVNAEFKMWDWTVDSLDWNLLDKPDEIVEGVSKSVHRDKEVILMHERKQTVEALPRILKILEKKGYAFEVYDPNTKFTMNFSGDSRL
ncbi:polysaccharide deacetylase family protein [Paenibacillus illinoisensis]|uniref:polysaccharide deacetylase family protein n=1 Tax=Paenibacillus illinoisensis TaxID=59845 RepID=UPI003D2A689E